MKARLCLVFALSMIASCTRSNKQAPTPGTSTANAASAPTAAVRTRAAWVERDGDTVERVGAAWAAWQRGDRASLKQAAEALCPPEHCAARRASHLLSKVDGAPNAIVTNTGVLLLEAGAPKRVVPMALGAGAYAKEWRDGRIIVDSPRYRRAYVVDTATGAVEKLLERQASDGQPSLLDVAPDLSSYVYVARDGIAQLVDSTGSAKALGISATGTRLKWPFWFKNAAGVPYKLNPRLDGEPRLVPPGSRIRRPEDVAALTRGERYLAMPEITASVFSCEKRLGVACSKRKCVVAGLSKLILMPDILDEEGEGWQSLQFSFPLKYILTVPDPTPDVLDNDAGFGFVDGEHHEILLVGCDGKVTKRTSTAAEEEHHVTAEAEAWRTSVTPQLCSARDAVLPAAACDELDVGPFTRVP